VPDEQGLPRREQIGLEAYALNHEWSQEDQLGFSDYATALADLIEDERTRTPLTVGIEASWGMGKTTLMHMIRGRLMEDRPHAPPLPTAWFNAWRYDKEEPIWAALGLEILTQIRERMSLRRRVALWVELNRKFLDVRLLLLPLARALLFILGIILLAIICLMAVRWVVDVQITAKQAWRYIGLVGGLGVVVTLYNTIGKDIYRRLTSPFKGNIISPFELRLARYVGRPDYEEKVSFLADFQRDFQLVMRAVTDGGRRPLIVFIDDLDRTTPPKSVEIIEAINTWLDSEHCIFILAMDSRAMAKSIEVKYKDVIYDTVDTDEAELTLGRRFLEKTVDLSFEIPKPDPNDLLALILNSLEDTKQESIAGAKDSIEQSEQWVWEDLRQRFWSDESSTTAQEELNIPSEEEIAKAKADIRAKSFRDSKKVLEAFSYAVAHIGSNLHKLKRFINQLKLEMLIANRRGLIDDGTIQVDLLAKWVLLSTGWPTVTQAVMDEPDLISLLLKAHSMQKQLYNTVDESERARVRSQLEPLLANPRIEQLYRDSKLIELLKDPSFSKAEWSPYLYLAARSAASAS
jgi:hypothetical protein